MHWIRSVEGEKEESGLMGETTKISWCQHTFNGWIGCTKISPACDGCYAEAMMDKRYGRVSWGGPGKGNGTRFRTSDENWRKPLLWDRKAKLAGAKHFVFCSSLADVFDNHVPTEWRRDLFELIIKTPNLVWLLLTKRPQNIVNMFRGVSHSLTEWPRNAAIGATVEDQKRFDLNAPSLRKAKRLLEPAFSFLSCEPLLGLISGNFHDIDWVIAGGETDQGGHDARPTHPDWLRSLRDQCAEADVPFHLKQNGEWIGHEQVGNGWDFTKEKDGVRFGILSTGGFEDRKPVFGGREFETRYPWPETYSNPCMVKVGKHRSGRMLDGREHNDFPKVG